MSYTVILIGERWQKLLPVLYLLLQLLDVTEATVSVKDANATRSIFQRRQFFLTPIPNFNTPGFGGRPGLRTSTPTAKIPGTLDVRTTPAYSSSASSVAITTSRSTSSSTALTSSSRLTTHGVGTKSTHKLVPRPTSGSKALKTTSQVYSSGITVVTSTSPSVTTQRSTTKNAAIPDNTTSVKNATTGQSITLSAFHGSSGGPSSSSVGTSSGSTARAASVIGWTVAVSLGGAAALVIFVLVRKTQLFRNIWRHRSKVHVST